MENIVMPNWLELKWFFSPVNKVKRERGECNVPERVIRPISFEGDGSNCRIKSTANLASAPFIDCSFTRNRWRSLGPMEPFSEYLYKETKCTIHSFNVSLQSRLKIGKGLKEAFCMIA